MFFNQDPHANTWKEFGENTYIFVMLQFELLNIEIIFKK
jgi:hypothetical protein